MPPVFISSRGAEAFGLLFLKQRLSELFRVEGLQIFRLLAETDEFDGQAKLFLDCHHHAALAGAVELGDDQAGERHGLVKLARLVERVHASGRIQHQQHLVRRPRPLFADDAVQFLQFLHEIVLGVQAARRIEEQIVHPARLRGGDGVMGHRGGIRPIAAGDDFHLEAVAPHLDLLDGRGAERVAGGEQDGFFLRLEIMRQLGAGRGLSRAVDADDGDDRGATRHREQVRWGGGQVLFHFGTRNREHIGPGGAPGFIGQLDGGDDLVGHGRAEIGADQGVLEFLER